VAILQRKSLVADPDNHRRWRANGRNRRFWSSPCAAKNTPRSDATRRLLASSRRDATRVASAMIVSCGFTPMAVGKQAGVRDVATRQVPELAARAHDGAFRRGAHSRRAHEMYREKVQRFAWDGTFVELRQFVDARDDGEGRERQNHLLCRRAQNAFRRGASRLSRNADGRSRSRRSAPLPFRRTFARPNRFQNPRRARPTRASGSHAA